MGGRKTIKIAVLFAVMIFLGSETTFAYKGGNVSNGGSISGSVSYSGSGSSKTTKVTKDNKVCGMSIPLESIIVSGGKLKNVVVSLIGIKKGKKIDKTPKAFDNKRCRFVPHVVAVSKGGYIAIGNQDTILHNTHGYLNRTFTVFNLALPMKGQVIKKKMKKAGIVNVSCDAGHVWMSGYIVVASNPYFAVSGSNGSFKIGNIPPGKYKVKAWHEKLGAKTTTVTVPSGGNAKVTFSY